MNYNQFNPYPHCQWCDGTGYGELTARDSHYSEYRTTREGCRACDFYAERDRERGQAIVAECLEGPTETTRP